MVIGLRLHGEDVGGLRTEETVQQVGHTTSDPRAESSGGLMWPALAPLRGRVSWNASENERESP